jgi:glutamate/tyrosine decarboxylase-like PLP-dependent enzyme
LTIDWIRQILGFHREASGLFVGGGSIANLAALAVARHTPEGVAGRALRIYFSSETHYSIAKAAALLGIGRENICWIGVDENFKIRLDELERHIAADRAAGHLAFCVVANAGTVNTGAVDPLPEMRALADRHGLWLHVDGSYGAFAILAPAVTTCSRRSRRLTLSRSIRTSGFTCRSTSAVSSTATPRKRELLCS